MIFKHIIENSNNLAVAIATFHLQYLQKFPFVEPESVPAGASVGKPVPGMLPAGGAIDFEGHVGKRAVLVGDAGGFVSAASGEGIYPSMLSARAAAARVGRYRAARSRAGRRRKRPVRPPFSGVLPRLSAGPNRFFTTSRPGPNPNG